MAKTSKVPTTDDSTLRLIREVKTRKDEIEKAQGRPNYVTNMSFSYSLGKSNDNINLNVESDIAVLVSIVSFLRRATIDYDATAADLAVESPPPFRWSGFTPAQWESDIRTRLAKVQLVAKQKKLDALEARLNGIISPELRAKMAIEEIERELA